MLDTLAASLHGIDAVFLDLDGTIYLGGEIIPGALEFLDRLKKRGIRRFFLSNSSNRSLAEYVEKLGRMGISAVAEEIMLSTHDLIAWLATEQISDTYLVGTSALRQMLEDAGVSTDSDNPQYVVLGYDTEITYDKLETAAVWLHKGVPLVASHPDIVCPSPRGGIPDVGAFLALFKAATGVEPTHIAGKPNPGMLLHKIDELGLQPERCAMIGDRLYTDMELAERAGVYGILVLSGEATEADLARASQNPSLVVGSVAELAG